LIIADGREFKVYACPIGVPFFDALCFLMIGFDRGQPPTPGRQASKHTPRVNSKAGELTFPCCESRGGLSGINSG